MPRVTDPAKSLNPSDLALYEKARKALLYGLQSRWDEHMKLNTSHLLVYLLACICDGRFKNFYFVPDKDERHGIFL